MTSAKHFLRQILPDKDVRIPLAVAGGIVLAHLGVNTAHGIAHTEIPVVVTSAQTAFIVVVMFVAPLVALGLIATGHRWTGGAVLASSMAGAFVFGIAFHYVFSTPDHVTAVPADPWQGPFRLTAALLVLVDAAGVVVGTWLMRTVWLPATAERAEPSE